MPLENTAPSPNQFDSVQSAIKAIADGEIVIIADDEDRENEGDFVCAAEKVTPEIINFMAKAGRGLICMTMTPEHCEHLQLSQMTTHSTDPLGTAFTVSIDAAYKFGVTTGISASDRAITIQVATAPDAVPSDLRRPGHIFPLQAKPGGVLERVGQTEASVDIARLAGLKPAGVICEIMNEDGTMARRDELFAIAKTHNLKFITVAQLINYRLQTEKLVHREAVANMPTQYGRFQVVGYRNTLDGSEHLALIKGHLDDLSAAFNESDISGTQFSQTTEEETRAKAPLVRVHSECLTGDVLGSLRCDCGEQLHQALSAIDRHGKGVLVYMRNHEGRGIGLLNKMKAYALQDKGFDTVEANLEMGFPADLRQYGIGAQILKDLGVKRFHLLTNNPRKIRGLDGYGLEVLERVPLRGFENKENARYLKTKQEKLGHLL
ncbi:MAG: bifunctional 3,4-dihydroxy-2-butanone-4-phosphate synthase/GTP cyclohydrolase II [Cyanobacteria bacterium P01_H01_bin.74]